MCFSKIWKKKEVKARLSPTSSRTPLARPVSLPAESIRSAAPPSVPTPVIDPPAPASASPPQPPDASENHATQSERNALWEEARKTLTQEELDIVDTSQDIKQVLQELLKATEQKEKDCEDKQWTYTTLKGERRLVKDSVSACLTNLTKLIPIGDAAVGASPIVSSGPWGIFKFLLTTVKTGVENTTIILESVEGVSRILSHCATYENLYIVGASLNATSNLQQALKGLYISLLKYFFYIGGYFGRNSPAQYAQGMGEAVRGHLADLLKNISDEERGVRDEADLAAKEDQNQRLKDLAKSLQGVVGPINRIESKLDQLCTVIHAEKRCRILSWISDISFKEHHMLVNSSRHPDTGNWLLGKQYFFDWKKPDSKSLFWLHGPPGSGKTVLASHVIHIMAPAYNEHCIAYFYCNYKEPDRRDSRSILRSIVKQLCLQSPTGSLPASVLSIYNQREERSDLGRVLNIEEIKGLLVRLCEGFLQTVIVIDALDECYVETRGEIIDVLTHLTSSTKSVKIFFTSRDDGDIRKKMEGTPDVLIQERENGEDINLYIDSQIEDCIKGKRFQCDDISELKVDIIQALREKAHGMFLWVKYQIDKICLEATPNGILEALKELPESLEETYMEVMGRMDKPKASKRTKGLAKKVLRWILYAQRPLSTEELIEAISIQPPNPYSFEETGLTQSTILDICQNLVVFDEGLGVLRFAHFSVQEFLLNQLEPSQSHTMVAEVCLTLLTHHFAPGPQTPALKDYSTESWAEHVRLSGSGSACLKDLCTGFLDLNCTPAYNSWVESISTTNDYFTPSASNTLSPLLVSCYYQLHDISKSLLAAGADPGSKNEDGLNTLHICAARGDETFPQFIFSERPKEETDIYIDAGDVIGRSPLSWAAQYGKAGVVQVLLEKGASVYSADKNGRTPLSLAADSAEVVQMLLEKGASVDSADKNGRTPLSWGAGYGKAEVVQMLLEKGASVYSADKNGRTPLSWGAGYGKAEVVRMLLEKGASVDSADKNGRTPLSWGAWYGKAEVVQMLLEKGASVDSAGKNGRTPLSWGARHGNAEVAQMLLEKGASVDSADKNGRTPLSWGAGYGKAEVVRMLLEKGASVDSADNDGRTPLSLAADSAEVVQMLLEKGASVDSADKNGRTPLSWGAEYGEAEVVQVLLENGASVDNADNGGRTPLLWGVGYGKAEVVQMLLEKGAFVDSADKNGRTPLSWGAEYGEAEVVQVLLENGASVDNADNGGRTPLSWGAQYGKAEVVRMLLEKGASVDSADKNGRTPLSWGAQYGKAGVVQMLLEKGAFVDSVDKDGRTPLSWGARYGKAGVVQVLLKKGTSIDSVDDDGRTPLSWGAQGGDVGVVQALLEKGASVDRAGKNGRTPLSWGARHGKAEVVQMLLEKGASVDSADKNGHTPLSWGAWYGKAEVVQMLLEKEASVDSTDNEGRTPLDLARGRRNAGVVRVLERWIEDAAESSAGRGADILDAGE